MMVGKNKQGFTIVELLIVVVVIAILAAITIVGYNGIQNRAYITSVSADLKGIAGRAEQYAVYNNVYPDNTTLFDGDYKVKISNAAAYLTGSSSLTFNVTYCTTSDNKAFGVAAVAKNGTRLFIRSGSGVQTYTGAFNWLGSDVAGICDSVVTGSTNSGNTGYRSGGSNSGWREWTGV